MIKNLISNGTFDTNIEGWNTGGSSRSNSGSTISRDLTQKKAGVASGKVVTPGLLTLEGIDSSGIAVKAGITYRIVIFVKGNAGGEKLQVFVGDSTVGNKTKTLTATTEWQRVELEYTPTGTGNTGVAVVTQAKSVNTFWIDVAEMVDISELSNYEKFVCNGFNFNDQIQTSLESLNFIPAQPKAKLAENPNSDGVLLVEEPHFTPAYFEAQVRILTKPTLDEALMVVGELIDALQGLPRMEGGALVEWTPNTTTTTYEAYGLFAELVDVPITPEGELAGWFVRSPVIKIKLVCRPFLHTEERVVLETSESSEQFQTVFIGGIGGDVPAEARMIVTDKATQLRRFVEWGQDLVESETNPSIRLKGEALSVTGTSSTKVVRPGSVSGEVIKATLLYGVPITICTTGPIANVGTFRAKLRVLVIENFLTGPICALRLSYKIGEGSETKRKWVEVPQTNNWVEIDLEEVFAEEVERGEQVTQIQIQGEGTIAGCTIYVDTLSLIPTKRYAVGRGKLNYTEPSTYSGYDQFFTLASGALTGRTAELGGAWSGSGDSDDFTVNSSARTAQRTAISDVAGTPRYALLGTTSFSDIVANTTVWTTNSQWDEKLVMGILVRYVDSNNWLMFGVKRRSTFSSGAESNAYYGMLYKKVAGVKTEISNQIYTGVSPLVNVTTSSIALTLIALSTGEWKVGTGGVIWASGIDTDLGVSGALKTGKIGLFDEKNGATAETRSYDNFQAFVPTVAVVCNPGKALEIDTQGANLEDTASKYRSPMPEYRGADLYLDPAGKDNLINRLAVKMRRNDIPTEIDPNVTDKQALKVYARERFLSPR